MTMSGIGDKLIADPSCNGDVAGSAEGTAAIGETHIVQLRMEQFPFEA